jgi:hypothetical protein
MPAVAALMSRARRRVSVGWPAPPRHSPTIVASDSAVQNTTTAAT